MKRLQKRGMNKHGFTMVEVLVALVILSVGLLAVAGMQTTSLKGGNSALYRTQAVFLAQDILDRMRAHRGSGTGSLSDYVIVGDDPAPDSWSTIGELEDQLDTYTGMVLTDLAEWKFAVNRFLAGGKGSIEVDGNVVTVTVQWQDSYKDDEDDDGEDSIELVTKL